MSWDACTGGGGWDSGPATHDNFTSQDARSGLDRGGDTKTANDYGNDSGQGGNNGYDGAYGGNSGGNDDACFNCGEQGFVKLRLSQTILLATNIPQPYEVGMPKSSCSP